METGKRAGHSLHIGSAQVTRSITPGKKGLDGVGNSAQPAGDKDGLTTSLYLVVDDPAASTPAGLGSVLERLGFLADGALGEQLSLPLSVYLMDLRLAISTGPDVTQQLDRELACAPVSAIGLDVVPSWTARPVIAIAVDHHRPTNRTAAAHAIAFVASSIAAMVSGLAIFWPPARLWSTSTDLAGAVIAMQANALPPVLHFVAFSSQVDATQTIIATTGLSWFAGHELVVSASADQFDVPQVMRRAGRLSIDAMVNGAIADGSVVPGLEAGEQILLNRTEPTGHPPFMEARIMQRRADPRDN